LAGSPASAEDTINIVLAATIAADNFLFMTSPRKKFHKDIETSRDYTAPPSSLQM
jgi:hypothetical protein